MFDSYRWLRPNKFEFRAEKETNFANLTTKPKNGYTANYLKTKGNPNEFLGKRKDLTPSKIFEIAKKFKEAGATIIGGCCETGPAHIEAMAKLK